MGVFYNNKWRKTFLLSFAVSSITLANAQVGVNTESPLGVFHVDGKGDTKETVQGSTIDDVLVDGTGKVGIGTISPTELLHVEGKALNTGDLNTTNLVVDGHGLIKGKAGVGSPLGTSTVELVSPDATIKIEDTDYAPGKYLTADQYGNASWEYLRPDYKVVGMNETTGVLTPLYNTTGKEMYGGTYVDLTDNPLVLTKGKWLILAKFTAAKVGNNSAGTDMLLWTQLRSKPVTQTTAPTKVEVVYGFKPEISGLRLVTPSLSYMVDIDEDTEYRIFATISVLQAERFATYPGFGDSFFVAIRLDDKYTKSE